MASFFTDLFGGGSKGKGHTLGSRQPQQGPRRPPPSPGGRPQAQGPTPQGDTYRVTFNTEDQVLGMTIVRSKDDDRPVVAEVVPGGAAHTKGVAPGDKVFSVDGNHVATFEAVECILPAIGRPVVFCIERMSIRREGGGVKPGVNVASSPGGGNGGFVDSEREARARAAEVRSKAWDSKLSGTRHQRSKSRQEEKDRAQQQLSRFDASKAATDDATRELVQRAKAMEMSTASSLGYNPYEARLGSTHVAQVGMQLGSVGVSSQPSPPPPPPHLPSQVSSHSNEAPSPTTSGGTGGFDAYDMPATHLSHAEMQSAEAHAAAEEVEVGLAVMVSQEREAWMTAASTMVKMLQNVIGTPENEKFRRIRVSNPTFQSRVASVEGAIPVLQAAGFKLHQEGDEVFLHIAAPQPLLPLATRVAYDRLSLLLEQAGAS